MVRTVEEIAASWLFAFAAGWALWPPGGVYWERVAAVVGDRVTLAVVGLLAVGLGAAFVRLTGAGARSYAVGALLAYVSGMVAIELAVTPWSPAHLVLYGGLLGGSLAGAALWQTVAGRQSDRGLSAGS